MPHRLFPHAKTLFFIQWLILVAALLIIGTILGLISYREHQGVESQQAYLMRNQAQVVAKNIDQQLESVCRALLGVREDIPAWKHEGSWAGANRRLKAFSDAMPGVRTLLIIDAKGTVLASSRKELLGRNFSWREYYKAAHRRPDPDMVYLSPPFASVLGVYSLTLSMTMPDPSGEFGGVIVSSLNPEFFSTVLKSVNYAPDVWSAIAHSDGLQFLMEPMRKGMAGKNLAVPGSFFTRHMQSGRKDSLLTGLARATGEERMMALRTMKPSSVALDKSLILAVGRNIKPMYAKWRRKALVESILLACITLLAVTGLAIFQRRQRQYWEHAEKAQAELRDSELWMRTFFNSLDMAAFMVTPDRRLVNCNETALNMFGYSMEEMKEQPTRVLHVDDDHYREFGRRLQGHFDRGEVAKFEFEARRKNGQVFPSEHTVGLLSAEDGEPMGIMSLVRDITERRQVEQQRQMTATVFENSLEGIIVADPDGKVQMVNPAYSAITGFSAKEIVGSDLNIFRSETDDPGFVQELWAALTEKGRWSGEYWNRRKNGEAYPEWLNVVLVKDFQDRIANIVVIFHDITDIKLKEEQITYQANHDALTGLPNRALLSDRLNQTIAHAERKNENFAVVFLDLDHFKRINDSLGHQAGDILLKQTAKRIKSCLREGDTISRQGGDEFVIILPGASTVEETTEAVRRISTVLERPFSIQGRDLFVTTSMGITFFPDDAKDAETLIKNADMAMYQAKGEGRNKFHLFTSALDALAQQRMQLELLLYRALERDELAVHYQPRVDLASGSVVGMEALVRWQRPGHGLVMPGDFIPLAEETGLILPIGGEVLEKACRQTHQWHQAGHAELCISVNISPRQFEQENLAEMVDKILRETGLPATHLELEITETAIMKDVDKAMQIMADLTSIGVKLSLDDFGTGYSSLNYFKRFPINTLKIDQSFVRDINRDFNDAAIVKTIIAMGMVLDLQVVAEGVETADQLAFLREQGCNEYQGYYFSRPIPAEEFQKLLKKD